MKILVIGSGGREHALAWKCSTDKFVEKVYVAPGNAGTFLEEKIENISLDINNNDFLNGEEASFIAVVSDDQIIPLATSQDHKAVGDGDVGLNTGGMGAYSPAPIVTDEIHKRVIDEVMLPTMNGLKAEGFPYLGFLYAGLMIEGDEIKVLEFNCRFGDPETQPIMLRLESSLTNLCLDAINKKLNAHQVEWSSMHSCGVVLASSGYPEDYETDMENSFL